MIFPLLFKPVYSFLLPEISAKYGFGRASGYSLPQVCQCLLLVVQEELAHRWNYILVYGEQVGRVVPVLECNEMVIVRTISLLGASEALVFQVIDVSSATKRRHQRAKPLYPFASCFS
jgi:hypothetical protein